MLLLGTALCSLLCACATVESASPRMSRTSNLDCKTLVCEQVHEQAKGLSKLALLDEFVSQTVFLLNDLMKNIDGELEKSANSLLRYIHPHCESSRLILEEVIQKQQEREVPKANGLGSGIAPMGEDEFSTDLGHGSSGSVGPHYHEREYDFSQKSDGGGIHVDKYGDEYDDYETERPPVYGTTTHGSSSNSGGFYIPKENARGGKFGQGWSSKKETESSWKESDWNGQGSSGSKGSEWKGYGKKEHGSGGWGGGKALNQHDYEGEIESQRNKKGCRGVDKGSAFWVPNLDQWCVDNCSKGYCPKTHCIC